MRETKTELLYRGPEQVAWLVLRTGSRAGSEWQLGADNHIGRDPTCDIVVADSTVSGKHARIKKEGRVYVIYDLGSTNGTYVNNVRVQREVLHHSDIIRVGATEFAFVYSEI